jgi:hypothetical protein
MRLVAVTGGKGGPGATTLAVGLAGAWAAAGQSVLLVDLDPAGGDVAAHLPVADVRRGVAPLLGSPGVPLGPAAVLAEIAQVNRRVGLLAAWRARMRPGCCTARPCTPCWLPSAASRGWTWW